MYFVWLQRHGIVDEDHPPEIVMDNNSTDDATDDASGIKRHFGMALWQTN